jgi:hypothetical protein
MHIVPFIKIYQHLHHASLGTLLDLLSNIQINLFLSLNKIFKIKKKKKTNIINEKYDPKAIVLEKNNMISIQQQNDMSTYKKLFYRKMWRPNVKELEQRSWVH